MIIGSIRTLTFAGLLASTATLAGAADAATSTDGTERVTRASAGYAGEHAPDELRDPLSFKEATRSSAEISTKPRAPGALPSGAAAATVSFGDSWVYDASTAVFDDYDGDGYYSYLRVRFDADTVYTTSWLYAEIYVSADGNAWELLYTTDDFAVWGSSPDDDYEVETALVSGYSTGLYDVLIDLYDADTGELVDEFGPNESSAFSLLPLEDTVRDGAGGGVVHGHGGGGAASWLLLSGLAAALWHRRREILGDRNRNARVTGT